MEVTSEKEIIFNPVTGEKLVVLESSAEIFKFEFSIDPRSEIAGEHLHPFQQQRIFVTSGELHCRINGVNHVLFTGDTATIPAGAHHFQANPTDKEARAIEEHRPAGRIHSFFRVLFTLAQEGKTNRRGIPKPLIGAAFVAEFKDTVRVSSVSLRILFAALAPISRLLGYRRTIRRYIEKFEAAEQHAATPNLILKPAEHTAK